MSVMTRLGRAIAWSSVRQAARTQLARAFAGSFMVAVLSRLVQVALAVVIARRAGADGYGAFVFAVGVAMILGQLCTLGWATLMNRLIPEYRRDHAHGLLRGLVNAGDAVVLMCSLVASGVLFTAARWLGASPEISAGLALAIYIVLPFSFTRLRMQQLAANQRAPLGLLFDQGFGATILLAAVLLGGIGTIDAMLAVYGGGTLLAIAISTVIFRRAIRADIAGARGQYRWATWFAMATPMVVGNSAKLIMSKTDILMLAPLAGLAETGVYGAAWRLTYVLSFPQVILMTVMTPVFSAAFRNGNTARIRRSFGHARLFTIATTVPPALLMVIAPSWIMRGIFGPEFTEGGTTLVILTIAQLIASFSVAQAALLMMGGRERAFGAFNLAVLALHVAVNLWLIPRFGAEGAAWGTLVSSLALWATQYALCRPLLRPAAPERAASADGGTTG